MLSNKPKCQSSSLPPISFTLPPPLVSSPHTDTESTISSTMNTTPQYKEAKNGGTNPETQIVILLFHPTKQRMSTVTSHRQHTIRIYGRIPSRSHDLHST